MNRSSSAGSPTPQSQDLPQCCVCGAHRWLEQPPTQLFRCAECGATFNARSLTRADEEALYSHYSEAAPLGDDRIAAEQWRWVQDLVAAPVRSVLDVGCGYGAFLKLARAAGCETAGIELDPLGAKASRAAGLDVRHGSVFDVEFPEGPWDLITLWDVLEHLEHPADALAKVVTYLAPGGTLVARGRNAEVHARLKVTYKRFRGVLSALHIPDLSCVHRWGFGRRAYERLFRSAGLESIRTFPGIPTPGDRNGSFRRRALASGLKSLVKHSAVALHGGSGGRVYPFPSVLVVGRKGDTPQCAG